MGWAIAATVLDAGETVLGAMVGILQWLVLRRSLKKAEWWILATFLSWVATLALATAMPTDWDGIEDVGWSLAEAIGLELDWSLVSAMGLAATRAVSGAVSGAITGLALVLLPQRDNSDPAKSQPQG